MYRGALHPYILALGIHGMGWDIVETSFRDIHNSVQGLNGDPHTAISILWVIVANKPRQMIRELIS